MSVCKPPIVNQINAVNDQRHFSMGKPLSGKSWEDITEPAYKKQTARNVQANWTDCNVLFMQPSHCPEVDPQWTHKYVPSAGPPGICWHAKDFLMYPEVDAEVGETEAGVHTMDYDALMNVLMFYDVL